MPPRTRATKRKRRRRRRVIIAVVLLIGSVVALNFWTLLGPQHLEARVREILDEKIAFPYTFDSIRYSIFDGLTIENLAIESPNAAVVSGLFPDGSVYPNVLEVARVHLDLGLAEVLRGEMPIRRITIVQPRIYVEIDEDLSTPLARMLHPSDTDDPGAVDLPEVIVEDLEVRTCPRSTFKMREPLAVDRFSLTLLDGRDYEFSGIAKYPLVRRVRLSGTGNRDDRTFVGKLEFARLQLDNSVREGLPERFRPVWDEYQPSGMANATVEFSLAEGRIADWRIVVEVIEANLRLTEPSIALESVNGSVEVVPEQAPAGDAVVALSYPGQIRTIDPLRGRAFGGEAELSGSIDLENLEVVDGDLNLHLAHIPLEDTRRYLAGEPALLEVYDVLGPVGIVSLDLGVTGGPNPVVTLGRVELEDVSLRVAKYPIENLSGDIVRNENDYAINLAGGTEGMPITVNGTLGAEEGAEAQVHVGVKNIVLNERLRQALPPVLLEVWELLRPGGLTDFDVTIARAEGSSKAIVESVLTPTNASMRYRDFPYQLSSITGKVTVLGDIVFGETTYYDPRLILLGNMRSMHGDSEVYLDAGKIEFKTETEPFKLELPIRSPSLLVEDGVIDALPADAAELIRSLNVAGRLDTTVDIGLDPELNLLLDVVAEIKTPVTIAYQYLDYPLTFHKGKATFTYTEETTRFEGFQTHRDHGPEISISGEAGPGAEEKEQLISLQVKVAPGEGHPGLKLDDPVLVKSLPEDARNILEGLAVTGFATCDLTVNYRFFEGRQPEERRQHVVYNGPVRVIDSSCQVGVKIEEINTPFELHGEGGYESPHTFTIGTSDGSFRFSRFLVNEVAASFVYGREHDAIRRAREYPNESIDGYRPNQQIVSRLFGNEQTRQALQLWIRNAKVYDGNLQGLFFVDVGNVRDFMGSFQATEINLAVGGPEIFKADDIKGWASGHVLFSGDLEKPDRLWGEGGFWIKRGRLTKIPLMANVLMNPLWGILDNFDRSRAHVREVEGRFKIASTGFSFAKEDPLQLRSKAVTLQAWGGMDFDQNIDFIVEPYGSIFGLPIFGPVIDNLSRVRMYGPLEDPKTSAAPNGELKKNAANGGSK